MVNQSAKEWSLVGSDVARIEVRTEAGEIIALIEPQSAEANKGFVVAVSWKKPEEEK